MEAIDFLRYFLVESNFSFFIMIVSLAFTFILLSYKLYKYAALFSLLFIITFSLFITGPMGQGFIKKFKNPSPKFKVLNQEEIDELKAKRKAFWK